MDIDTSWNLENNTTSPFYSFLNEGNDFRVYYTVRNRVNFEQNIITSQFSYKVQKGLFLFFMNFYKNDKNRDRYKVFKQAIDDGLNNRLGKTI